MSNEMEKEIEELKAKAVEGINLDVEPPYRMYPQDLVLAKVLHAALELVSQLHKRLEVLEKDNFKLNARIIALYNKEGLKYLEDK